MVDFKRYFRMLKDAGLNYPISLHCEYEELGGANKGKRELTIPESEVLAVIKRDVKYVRELWETEAGEKRTFFVNRALMCVCHLLIAPWPVNNPISC